MVQTMKPKYILVILLNWWCLFNMYKKKYNFATESFTLNSRKNKIVLTDVIW